MKLANIFSLNSNKVKRKTRLGVNLGPKLPCIWILFFKRKKMSKPFIRLTKNLFKKPFNTSTKNILPHLTCCCIAHILCEDVCTSSLLCLLCIRTYKCVTWTPGATFGHIGTRKNDQISRIYGPCGSLIRYMRKIVEFTFHKSLLPTAMTWEQEVQAEQMAFSICDSDRMVGLTWKEVESCIERYSALLETEGIDVPTYENFHAADLEGNNDGTLTMDEWLAWAEAIQQPWATIDW